MLDTDCPEGAAAVKGHFSKATEEDALLVWDLVKGYSREDAHRAVKEHRLEKGSAAYRPDPRRIGTLAASFYRSRRPVGTSERMLDFVVRQDPLTYKGMDPLVVLQHYYRECWNRVREGDAAERGKAGARSLILNSARSAFRQEGLDDDAAEVEARAAVELADGERICRPAIFRTMPGPSDSSAEKARAMRELQKEDARVAALYGQTAPLPPVNPPSPRPAAPSAMVAADFDIDLPGGVPS